MTRIEAIAVGNELLSGDLADGHVQRFGAFFRARGLVLSGAQTVPDELSAIQEALALAMGRADVVLVTGGLGSTSDDVTVAALAKLTARELHEDPESVERIRQRAARRGREATEAQLSQALIPVGARALSNRAGSAPGVHLTVEGVELFLFPGVPSELEAIMADHLAPWVEEALPVRPLRSAVFKTFGETESRVATMLDGVDWDGAHVAYRATFPEIHVTAYLQEEEDGRAEARLEALRAQVRERLGDLIFGEGPEASLPDSVGDACLASGRTLALAESCTGGLLAEALSAIPGASSWLVEGVVTYSNEAKTRRLGVSASLIEARGAVSEEVARAMAEGVRDAAGADVGVGITGIAGPTGGSPEKPVGTVHVAVATAESTVHRHLELPFDRARNRRVSAWKALQIVLQQTRRTNT